MRVVIIDDDPFNLQLIQTFCTRFTNGLEVVGTAESVDEGIQVLIQLKPDLLFLDVELHDRTGFEILKGVQQQNLLVIMVTAYAEFAVDAFKVNVADYLLKPLLIPDFIRAVDKCKKLHEFYLSEKPANQEPSDYTKFISVQIKGQVLLLDVEEVVRFEADGSYTKVFIDEINFHTVSKGLSQLENGLAPSKFLRTHHSHIVNINFVKMLLRQKELKLQMQDGTEVPISERRRKEVLNQLGISA